MGFVEVIVLLFGLSDFSLQANPKPPTVDASLQYAMPDADIVLHVDAASFVPNNYKALIKLSNQPQIKASPELAKVVREVVAEVEGARGLASSMVGIDPTTDVRDATVFLQFVPRQDPTFIAAVRGKFSTTNIDKIAKLTSGTVARIGGGAVVELGPNKPAVAVTRDGVLLAGTPKLVRDRLADQWRAPARTTGSGLAHAAEVIAQKPVFAVALALSPTARKFVRDEHGPEKNLGVDLLQRHKVASFAVYHDGIGWTWQDRDRAGLDSFAQMSDGTIELLRAAHIAPRGLVKIVLGGLESYRGKSPQIDDVLRRRADIIKIVQSFTGDGTFKVKVDRNPASLRLDVRATGKTLSEVLPGSALPLVALVMGAGIRKKEAATSAPAMTPAVPGARKPAAPAPAPKQRTAPAPAPIPAPKQAPTR